jgi:transposase
MRFFNIDKIKVHFDGRCSKVRYARGPVNEEYPIFYEIREGSNDQTDFLSFIIHSIESNFWVEGDILVMDNASIHTGENIVEIVDLILKAYGVRIVLLPTFSPEFNPCELIFSYIKSHIYVNGIFEGTIQQNIIEIINNLSFENIKGWYKKCLYNCL